MLYICIFYWQFNIWFYFPLGRCYSILYKISLYWYYFFKWTNCRLHSVYCWRN